VLHGCYRNANGQLRIVDTASDSCAHNETAVEWGRTTRLTTSTQNFFTTSDLLFHERQTLGTFTKDNAGTRVRVTWQAPAWIRSSGGTPSCTFQLRVDGTKDTGSTSTAVEPGEGGDAVLSLDEGIAFGEAPIQDTADFAGLAAGPHTVTVWVRGVDGATCVVNPGSFTQVAARGRAAVSHP
jgi:hypothetical protein